MTRSLWSGKWVIVGMLGSGVAFEDGQVSMSVQQLMTFMVSEKALVVIMGYEVFYIDPLLF